MTRIEGEHHYAEWVADVEGYRICRSDDDAYVEWAHAHRYATAKTEAEHQLWRHDKHANHFIELGKQQREKPTGTIFELDLYAREGLERLAKRYESSYLHPKTATAKEIRNIAADLKPLIDNLMAQYCPDGGSDA